MSREKELEIIKQIDEKKLQITNIEDEISVLEKALLEEKSGFKEGELVINNKGEKGILTFNKTFTTFWHWRKLKKDGTPSAAVTSLWGEFERIEK